MPSSPNQLIALLPQAKQRKLPALGEIVPLVLAADLCVPGSETSHVYFPLAGFVSLVAGRRDTSGIEVGMVGTEGMLGTHLVLGVTGAPLYALVQGPGTALRIPAAAFRDFLGRNADLDKILRRYLYVLMAQFTTAAPCLRFHEIAPRLARWLLMCHDRAHADDFESTHEFLAYMLGVRRASVTVAAGALHDRGLIHYTRGIVSIQDRAGLEAFSCSCYAADCAAYTRVMGAKP
jgi:CRP-like cAMP-binding protein